MTRQEGVQMAANAGHAGTGTGVDAISDGWKDRVAVVVVHGVAEQDPGTTRDAVASLLVANAPQGVAYEVVGRSEFAIHVPPIDVPHRSLLPEDRGIRETRDICLDAALSPTQYATSKVDLERTVADQAGPARAAVSLFEMYWADQSRLSGFVPRIISELFTLIFRLSRLARGMVQYVQEGKSGLAWRLFNWSQASTDLTLVYLVAALALDFGLLVGVMAGMAAIGTMAAGNLYPVAVGALAVPFAVAALGLAYFWPWTHKENVKPVIYLITFLVFLCCLAILARILEGPRRAEPAWVFFGILVALASGIHFAILGIARKRFEYKPWIASLWWVAALIVMVGTACAPLLPGRAELAGTLAPGGGQFAPLWASAAYNALALQPADWGKAAFAPWIGAAVVAGETLLVAMKFTWILVGILVVIWFALSVVVCIQGLRDYVASGTVATGRLGFGISIMSLLLISMLAWAALSQGMAIATRDVIHRPLYFDAERPKVAESEVDCKQELYVDARGVERLKSIDASCFMQDRYLQSTRPFAALALLMAGLLVFLLVMVLPGALAETKTKIGSALQHGKWLTRCYRRLDAVVGVVVGLAAFVAIWIALDFAGLDVLGWLPKELGAPGWPDRLAEWSDRMLRPIVITAAGATSVFVLFGGLISKHLPQWRAPLDVVLDVDNYFRKWPRGGVPRAMMMSRFDALLKWLERRYDRILIVAHSQGTVITVDLLRFRVWRAEMARRHNPNDPQAAAPTKVHLATFGSPLRQLYAARFPALYKWVLAAPPETVIGGPMLRDTGIARWVNGFCSGDYVGRWLWSSRDAGGASSTGELIGHPAQDMPVDLARGVIEPMLGRYDENIGRLTKHTLELIDSSDRFECCLGYGAHTGYFQVGQTGSAWMIDHAILGALRDRAEPSPNPPCAETPPATA